MEVLGYENRWNQLAIRLDQDDLQSHPDLLKELVQQAYDTSGH